MTYFDREGIQAYSKRLHGLAADLSLVATELAHAMPTEEGEPDLEARYELTDAGVRMVGSEPPRAMPPASMRIETVDEVDLAIRMVGAWEGNTFDWHDDARTTLGILGFKGDELARLGGDHSEKSQLLLARKLYNECVTRSCAPRGIHSREGRAFAFDMAINNGPWHDFFAQTDRKLGLTRASPPAWVGYEKSWIAPEDMGRYLDMVAAARRKAVQHRFADLPGLETRYDWWADQVGPGVEWHDDVVIAPKGIVVALPPPTSWIQSVAPAPAIDLAAAPKALVSVVARGWPGWGPPEWYVALGWEDVYPPGYGGLSGGHHTGFDWNLPGDRDLGKTFHAPQEGLIVFAGEGPSTWGKVVVLEIDMGAGLLFHWRFAHAQQLYVRAGERVGRGQSLGTIGTSGGRFPAHLHEDCARKDRLPAPLHTLTSSWRDLDKMRKIFVDTRHLYAA